MKSSELKARIQDVICHYAACVACWSRELEKPEGFRLLAVEAELFEAETRLNTMIDYVCRSHA